MSRSKDKGTAAETAVVRYLLAAGIPATRQPLAGAHDIGDVRAGEWVLEVKAVVKPSYGAWLREAERERVNAAAPRCAVIHKPRGVADPAGYYVVMTLTQFADLITTKED